MRKGRIYLAPPGRHLIVESDTLLLGVGPRENNVRPAIDPMLRSVALCCGSRGIGAVLTGTLGDGASGLWALSRSGGITVVQDPRDAAFSEMPRTALDRVQPDHVAPLAEMPALLQALVHQPAGPSSPVSSTLKYEVQVARSGQGSMEQMDRVGRRSVLTCPDCDGVMWEIDEGNLVRYRCHLGHAYTAELMALALDESLRRALGSALRTIEERIALMQKLHKQAVASESRLVAATWAQRAAEYEQQATLIRDSIRRMEDLAEAASSGEREKAAAG
jgi:two-component system chemotaxis response regulator CheB